MSPKFSSNSAEWKDKSRNVNVTPISTERNFLVEHFFLLPPSKPNDLILFSVVNFRDRFRFQIVLSNRTLKSSSSDDQRLFNRFSNIHERDECFFSSHLTAAEINSRSELLSLFSESTIDKNSIDLSSLWFYLYPDFYDFVSQPSRIELFSTDAVSEKRSLRFTEWRNRIAKFSVANGRFGQNKDSSSCFSRHGFSCWKFFFCNKILLKFVERKLLKNERELFVGFRLSISAGKLSNRIRQSVCWRNDSSSSKCDRQIIIVTTERRRITQWEENDVDLFVCRFRIRWTDVRLQWKLLIQSRWQSQLIKECKHRQSLMIRRSIDWSFCLSFDDERREQSANPIGSFLFFDNCLKPLR